ncbi:MAG: endonuclease/exonuclease/phosphatase family protein, partial [Flavobacteriia bacterium]|nr:endonuclease/exonuclease/phosphatase family protein [Flavobacteriia bacterium]
MTTQLPKYLFALLIFVLFHTALAQQTQTIAFYNVENLFDTIDGPNDDAEFLPSAESKWDASKYEAKIAHIRQVMADLNMPMVMGVCEIENKSVLTDLIGNDKRYGIVHYDSPDARGIDAAMLYRKDKAKIILMGDLNDHPQDAAPQLIASKLTPQITKASGTFGGSYNY